MKKIYNDPDTLINEFSTNNISYNNGDIIWSDFDDSVMKQFVPSNIIGDSHKFKEKMIGFINIKDTIGEYIWILILSLLTILVSQNHLLSENCGSASKDNSQFQEYLNKSLSK